MTYKRFDEVLDALTVGEPALRETVEGKLAALGGPAKGRQAVQNIRAEAYVDETTWSTLIHALRACSDEWDELHDTVRDIMRTDQLHGPLARCGPETVFGRATSDEDLARVLSDQGFGTPAAARSSIRYHKTTTRDDVRDDWSGYLLGAHVMWATFDPEGDPPFARFVGEHADEVRARLGLPKVDAGKPLILLQYRLPPGKPPHFPRVTEAYSGSTWMPYFRPAGPTEWKHGYGRTFPWDEIAEGEGSGEPEVVHEPVDADQLFSGLAELI